MADGDDGGDGVVFRKAKGVRRARRGSDAAAAADDEDVNIVKSSLISASKRGRGLAESGHTSEVGTTDVHYSGAGHVLNGQEAEELAEHQAREAAAAATASSSSTIPATAPATTTADGQPVYTGEKDRTSYIRASESRIKGAGLRAGPVKASSYSRVVTVIDYQPSVCKDYKQTGYCGYGHNCKYLHDRGDYKSGWEIDAEWKRTGGKAEENYEVHSSEDSDNELPFACFICKGDFVDPVVTKCGHYFCEACALAQERKKKRCFICNEPTAGMFNQPKVLIDKLRARKEAAAVAAAAEPAEEDQ